MANRPAIPKGIREEVLGEYSHLCAVCAKANPQLHHIDEDNTNNDPLNLLPLCPNHHLSDQHNPTRKIPIPKLQMFWKYKDPFILIPQFDPVYKRQRFLDQISDIDEEDFHYVSSAFDELIEFVRALAMGDFYANQISSRFSTMLGLMNQQMPHNPLRAYHQAFIGTREEIKELLVELTRYQPWPSPKLD